MADSCFCANIQIGLSKLLDYGLQFYGMSKVIWGPCIKLSLMFGPVKFPTHFSLYSDTLEVLFVILSTMKLYFENAGLSCGNDVQLQLCRINRFHPGSSDLSLEKCKDLNVSEIINK